MMIIQIIEKVKLSRADEIDEMMIGFMITIGIVLLKLYDYYNYS